MAMSYIKPAGGLSAADRETARQWMVTGHELLHGKVQGTIPARAAATITPGISDQVLAAGQYLEGAQTIRGDAALLPENIRSGVSIFGVVGSFVGSGAAVYDGNVSWQGSVSFSPFITSDYWTQSGNNFICQKTVSARLFVFAYPLPWNIHSNVAHSVSAKRGTTTLFASSQGMSGDKHCFFSKIIAFQPGDVVYVSIYNDYGRCSGSFAIIPDWGDEIK